MNIHVHVHVCKYVHEIPLAPNAHVNNTPTTPPLCYTGELTGVSSLRVREIDRLLAHYSLIMSNPLLFLGNR